MTLTLTLTWPRFGLSMADFLPFGSLTGPHSFHAKQIQLAKQRGNGGKLAETGKRVEGGKRVSGGNEGNEGEQAQGS